MPLHVRIKMLLQRILPQAVFGKINVVWRRYFAKFFTDTQADARYFEAYKNMYGLRISGGPFAGLNYIPESAGSVLLLKLIGSYEEVLHPVIGEIATGSFDTIIDIGCAEGYYLTGLGKAKPGTTLIGYDIDERALALTKKLIEFNQLTNPLVLDTTCTFEKLKSQISDKTFLMCDAEGFEAEIINPDACPELKTVKMFVIETHEFAAPGVVHLLQHRLASSHTIELITFAPATTSKYPFLKQISNKRHLYNLLRERGEQEQQWIIARRK